MPIILKPEKWVQGGLTLAHEGDLPDSTGNSRTAAVFVHGAIPGETVEVDILRERSGHRFGVARRVLEPSSERIPSSCPIYPDCGGCSFRHISYEAELTLKRNLLGEMRHIEPHLAGIEVFSDAPDGYRQTARLHRQSGQTGFYGLWSEKLIPLPEQGCLHLATEINKAVQEEEKNADSDSECSYFLPASGRVLSDVDEKAKTEVEIAIGDFHWAFRPGMFFQANRFLIHPWLTWMKKALLQERSGPDRFRCVGLFCGTGLIGGFLSEILSSYRGFESGIDSVLQGKENFKRHGLPGKFQKADLYNHPERLGLPGFPADLWIVNPPRAGLKEPLCRLANQSGAGILLYSSCNPQTFDRDLGILQKGGFQIQRLAAFDFFPRTPHMEIVALLKRVGSRKT